MFFLTMLGGYWLAKSAAPQPEVAAGPQSSPPRRMIDNSPMPEFRSSERGPAMKRDTDALEAGALANQRVVRFSSREALDAFLARAGDRILVLDSLDALNALRVAFLDADDLAALLDGDEELSMIFPVEVPFPEDGTAQPGAMALGSGLLEWLGISDTTGVGTGIRIAVLDTGVYAHSAFGGSLTTIDLVERTGGPADINGHGTAVASMISGNNRLIPGVAPDAHIIDVRVANDSGSSNSWLLAQGIIAAADAGAHIVNISLGSFGDSGLVRDAIAYAHATGAVIVAAAGNQGLDRPAFPAANQGVIAVGAVDAIGNHVAFSNSGNIDVAAPGYGVNAAWPGGGAVRVDGTSFSAPIIAGSLAWIMSTQNVNANTAVELMNRYLNDAGAPGPDPAVGGGLPALDRIDNRNTPGIRDAAVASHHVIPPGDGVAYPRLQVVVQNRGTETLVNTGVTINHPGGSTTANITTLPPNGIHAVTVPLPIQEYNQGLPITLDSRVNLGMGHADANPANDRRVETHYPAVVR